MTDAKNIPRLRQKALAAEGVVMNLLSDVGERRNLDWLTYNPLRMRMFHRYALRDAPAVMSSLGEVFPEATAYVDVGCGSGAYAAEAQRRGHRVVGCERSRVGRLIAGRQGVDCRPFDLTANPATDLSEQFDLAYSFEVAEHLPEGLGERLVVVMANLAPVVVFTAASPGQGGTGHINEQPQSYWRSIFQRHGLELDLARSEDVRSGFKRHGVIGQWLIDNVQVFVR